MWETLREIPYGETRIGFGNCYANLLEILTLQKMGRPAELYCFERCDALIPIMFQENIYCSMFNA